MAKRIIRVFPSKTSATPTDDLAVVGRGPVLGDVADEVHISVSFSWKLQKAERLAKLWKHVAPVSIGGPATGQRSEEFVPGKYLRDGYVITSRGCPNKCWFCSVWKREGVGVRELSIVDGFNVQDDNLLACSDDHIKAVFQMLSRQTERARFTGGLEALRLKGWHVEEFRKLDPSVMLFAYDSPEDLEPLQKAGRLLIRGGIIQRGKSLCKCYVLVGFPQDTYDAAEKRIVETMEAGFAAYVMPFRGKSGEVKDGWKAFKNRWSNPLCIIRSIYEQKKCELIAHVKKS